MCHPSCGEGPGWGETGSTLPKDQSCPIQCTINPTLDSDLPTPHLGPSQPEASASSEMPRPPDASGLADLEMAIMAEGLLRLAGVGRALRASNGGCYAAIVVDGRVECYGAESEDFHRLLGQRYREATGRALPAALLGRVMETLRARAEGVTEGKFLCLRRSRRDGWRRLPGGSGRSRPEAERRALARVEAGESSGRPVLEAGVAAGAPRHCAAGQSETSQAVSTDEGESVHHRAPSCCCCPCCWR